MPDPVAILWAMAAAGVVTALTLLACSRLREGAATRWSWPLAVGLGFLAGAAIEPTGIGNHRKLTFCR
jgi:hypothetical protein